jgi:hypothetical protein
MTTSAPERLPNYLRRMTVGWLACIVFLIWSVWLDSFDFANAVLLMISWGWAALGIVPLVAALARAPGSSRWDAFFVVLGWAATALNTWLIFRL